VSASIIDGKAIAAIVRGEVAGRVAALQARGTTPGLAAVLVGDDPASKIYVDGKQRDCAEAGIASERIELPADTTQAQLHAVVDRLNADPAVHGILVQLPLPPQIDVLTLHERISPEKDPDGLSPVNVGRMVRGEAVFLPCTPLGIVEMLVRSGVDIPHREVTIVGRGQLVGMPLAHTRRAEILVVAAGRPGTVTAEMVAPGAAVIDVAVNRLPDGKLVGDVDFAGVSQVAGSITPVPGGVGPMTRAMLLVNTVTAAERLTAA
jgi:methylenetetrahydrofolate dehydrogenase (NADP+)/methenyltetrahydrofolate cyclohydrolase